MKHDLVVPEVKFFEKSLCQPVGELSRPRHADSFASEIARFFDVSSRQDHIWKSHQRRSYEFAVGAGADARNAGVGITIEKLDFVCSQSRRGYARSEERRVGKECR